MKTQLRSEVEAKPPTIEERVLILQERVLKLTEEKLELTFLYQIVCNMVVISSGTYTSGGTGYDAIYKVLFENRL